MAKNTSYAVFLIPGIIGIIFGGAVMFQASVEGHFDVEHEINQDPIRIEGLKFDYSQTEPIQVNVFVSDVSYDCGDLYITIYDSKEEIIAQNGYFEECFTQNTTGMPISEAYSVSIDEKAKYTMEANMFDRDRIKSIVAKETFYVR